MADGREQREKDKDAPFSGSSEEVGPAVPYDPLFPPGWEHDQNWLFAQAEKRLVAANDAIKTTRTFSFALLSIAAYIGVVVWGTTDEQLLRISPVKLPFINVEVPLTGFYVAVPWLFVLLHFNLLIHFGFTSRKLKRFLGDIAPLDSQLSERLRNDVSNFPLAQWMAGHNDAVFQVVLAILAWIMLVLIPPLLLLWIQFQFLAFQDDTFTRLQLAAVTLDILLIFGFHAWFVRQIQPESSWNKRWRDLARNPRTLLAALVHLTVPLILLVLAWGLANGRAGILQAEEFPSCIRVSGAGNDEVAYVSWLCEQYRLDLPEQLLTRSAPSPAVANALRSGDEKKQKMALGETLGLDLRERSLRGAYFQSSLLPNADLRRANLKDANLNEAQLQGANLYRAQLEGANLSGAQLDGVDLRGAKLEGANLRETRLNGADLRWAKLKDAYLIEAQLDGADLRSAELEGAKLGEAQLKGAILSGAQLEGANLSGAQLEGVDLRGAKLEGANLYGAKLEGAKLSGSQLEGADLRRAQLKGAYLLGAKLEGANLREARLNGADLRRAKLNGADLRGAKLEGANLRETRLNGADLRRANLKDAKLSGSQLNGADLRWAKLKGADLSEAQLNLHRAVEGAKLYRAQLEGANLSGAKLKGADLRRAQLKGADLSEAQLEWTNLTGADLSFADLTSAQNLETAELAGADYVFADGLEGTILDINQPPPDVLPASCDPCSLARLSPPVNR